MNYYKRHIGDYMKDASHLSLLEHGIYMRLMDVYYTRDTPLTPSMRLQMALLHGIEQMLSKAGVETVEEFVARIMALPARERDFMADQLDAFEYVGRLGSQREDA